MGKTYHCANCGSQNVYRKRISYWSDKDQTWIDENFADELHCAECATESIEERELA